MITDSCLKLFLDYAKDSINWSGIPMVGGNVPTTPENKGHLTALKKAGLITTYKTVDEDHPVTTWLEFTTEGVKLARQHGFNVDEY